MTAQELKNSILQLAIQGKLVKQDSNDEPASVLLKKIKKEREKLIKEKKIKKEKYSEIYKDPSDNHYYEKFEDGTIHDITDEIPFEIPNNWEWYRLGNICLSIFSGKSPKYSKLINTNLVLGQKNNQDYGIDLNGIKYCTNEFIENYPKEFYLKKNDILLNTLGGGTVGRSGIFSLEDNKYITDGHLFVFRNINEIISYYLLYYLKLNKIKIEKNANGSTNQMFLKLDNVKRYLIPLPPIEEQKRITEKIKLFLPFISNYNKINDKLDTLNTKYKEELKKSILQYAIQGKLVKQDSNDEPAEVLINKILDEKRELIKNKQIKKENLSIIYKDSTDNQFYEKFEDGTINNITDEIPFEIPDNWRFIRFNNLVNYKIGKTPPRCEKSYWNNDYNWVSISDMNDGKTIYKTKEMVSKSAYTKIFNKNVSPKGTLLMSFKLTIGKVSILDCDSFHNEAIISIYPYYDSNATIRNYLFKILPLISNYGNTKSAIKGKTLNSRSMNNLIIPICSLKEQKKIVNKINKLLTSL